MTPHELRRVQFQYHMAAAREAYAAKLIRICLCTRAELRPHLLKIILLQCGEMLEMSN